MTKKIQTDLNDLPVGTHFFVHNGHWDGRIFEQDGEKWVDVIGVRTFKLDGPHPVTVDIFEEPDAKKKVERLIDVTVDIFEEPDAKKKVERLIDVAKDELRYAKHADGTLRKEYIQNAIRFLNDALEETTDDIL